MNAALDPRGLAAVLVAAISFGLVPTLARLALDGGADMPTILAVRSILAWTGVYALARAMGERPALLSADGLRGALIGVPLAAASFGYLGAVRLIPVSLATLIFFTFPLVVALLARIVDKDKFTAVRLAALCTAFAGLAITLGTDFDRIDGAGIALAALASLSISLVFVLSNRLMRGVRSLSANFFMMSTSAVAFTAWMAASAGFTMPSTSGGWTGLLGGGLIYIFGIVGFFLAIQRIGPVRTALYINLEPLISLSAAFVLLHERLTGAQYAGGALILAAIALTSWRESRAGPTAT